MLWSEISTKANGLPDNRTDSKKVADAQRKAKRKGDDTTALEHYVGHLERQKEDRRFAKMSKEERQLAIARDILNREPEVPESPHALQDKAFQIITSIVNDPNRQRGDYDLARLVYESLGPGMDHDAGMELYKELVAQESAHLNTKRQGVLDRQSQLIAELQQLDTQLFAVSGTTPHNSQHYGILANSLNTTYGHSLGLSLTKSDRDEVLAAEGNAEAEAAVVAKHRERVESYLRAVEGEQNAGEA